MNDEASPIYGWSFGVVKESLGAYAKGKTGAKTLDRWAVTLKKLYPVILDTIVIPMMATHDIHSITWLGKSRTGKSTCSKTIGFAISAFQIDKHKRTDLRPSVITAKKVDFYRLEPGSKFKPAIGDDMALYKLEPDEYKAMGDPGEEDALLWARWGGASFEMNQSRQFCANPHAKQSEPSTSASTLREAIKLEDFLKMISTNWPKDSTEEDVAAYLNRSHFVLLTDNWIYYRFARAEMDSLVDRMPWPNPKKKKLFLPEATEILKKFKKDQAWTPSDYDADMKWGIALLQQLAQGVRPPQTVTMLNACPFTGANVTKYP